MLALSVLLVVIVSVILFTFTLKTNLGGEVDRHLASDVFKVRRSWGMGGLVERWVEVVEYCSQTPKPCQKSTPE